MHIFLTIVAFIVIFSVLILVHEFGHFMAAKKSGVKVEEFGMGLPPRLFGVKRGETIYSINWIPFGGFVRMLGEGDDSKEGKTSKRSYSNKPLRVQAFIVCAGVLMNLLLSFVLLTVGFSVGIEPLIATEEDFNQAIRDGTVHVEPGIVVLATTTPFEPGDRILGFETAESWQLMLDGVSSGAEAPLVSVDRADGTGGGEYLTKELIDQSSFAPLYVPRLIYRDSESSIFHGLLQTGDELISVQEKEVLTADDLQTVLTQVTTESNGPFNFGIYRPAEGELSVTVNLPEVHPIISYVEVGSPADQLGLQAGDEVWSVNGVSVHTAQQLVDLTHKADASIEYTVHKSGEMDTTILTIPLREDGRVGVSLTDPLPYYGDLSLYPSYTLHTLMGTDQVNYGWKAPVVAAQEMWRLGKMTASMFVGVLKQFVTAGGVPEGVSGPVGIAQMTGVTITQGFGAILRFVALLSLSLGVINILPFPALDGGHFALILLKAVSGKKTVNPRWERVINLGGFIFLLSFIGYITFNDILNLF